MMAMLLLLLLLLLLMLLLLQQSCGVVLFLGLPLLFFGKQPRVRVVWKDIVLEWIRHAAAAAVSQQLGRGLASVFLRVVSPGWWWGGWEIGRHVKGGIVQRALLGGRRCGGRVTRRRIRGIPSTRQERPCRMGRSVERGFRVAIGHFGKVAHGGSRGGRHGRVAWIHVLRRRGRRRRHGGMVRRRRRRCRWKDRVGELGIGSRHEIVGGGWAGKVHADAPPYAVVLSVFHAAHSSHDTVVAIVVAVALVMVRLRLLLLVMTEQKLWIKQILGWRRWCMEGFWRHKVFCCCWMVIVVSLLQPTHVFGLHHHAAHGSEVHLLLKDIWRRTPTSPTAVSTAGRPIVGNRRRRVVIKGSRGRKLLHLLLLLLQQVLLE